MTLNFSKQEQRLFHFLNERGLMNEFTLIEAADVIYQGEPRPEHWQQSVSGTISKTSLKMRVLGEGYIERVSKQGKGRKGVYRFAK